MPHPREEIEATVERYVETRKVIDAGGATWSALAQYFTDDGAFIAPAWGRFRHGAGNGGFQAPWLCRFTKLRAFSVLAY